MIKVGAIILAAGLSRRMGRENKLFLTYHGKPLVEWVISKINDSQVDELVLVTSELSHKRLKRYANNRIKVIENSYYKQGMTTSIQAGVEGASADIQGYMICLGDQPLIETEVYNRIITRFRQSFPQDKQCITVPFYQGNKGNPVIFSAHYKQNILAHKKPEGCKEIVQANKNHIQKTSLNSPLILHDVDTKEEYEQLIGKKR